MFFYTCGVNQFCITVFFAAVKPANNILFCIELIQRPKSSLRRHKLGLTDQSIRNSLTPMAGQWAREATAGQGAREAMADPPLGAAREAQAQHSASRGWLWGALVRSGLWGALARSGLWGALARSGLWGALARCWHWPGRSRDWQACHMNCRRACHRNRRRACHTNCRRACHTNCRRACFGCERRQACVGNRRQREFPRERRAWESRRRRHAWVSGSWQAWLGLDWQTGRRACVGRERRRVRKSRGRRWAGSGLDTRQTPENTFPPTQSGGVWEVHGTVVVGPEPEQLIKCCVIPRCHRGELAELPGELIGCIRKLRQLTCCLMRQWLCRQRFCMKAPHETDFRQASEAE